MLIKPLLKSAVVFGVAIIALSACSFGNKEVAEDDWQNDILMAEECGEEGLQCCADKDPECKYGSCCVDPNDPSKNYCSETCDFGKRDTFCMLGNVCDEGFSCSLGYCRECGGVDQPCCADKKCEGTLACFRDSCVECGVTGNPCCLTGTACKDEKSKGLDRSQCKDELCSLCGANSNVPCQAEPLCNENHLLNMNACYRCGGYNQPCCQKVTYEKTEKYCVEEGLSCNLDFCSKKGN